MLIGRQEETRDKITGNQRERDLAEVVLTNTHVFRFFPYWRRNRKQDMTIIQAFTVPDDDQPLADNRYGILRLSHEGILFQEAPDTVIRNSIVDPITGSIGVKFLSQWHEARSGLRPKCVDVTLHKPSPVDVSPITVRWHAVLTSENGPPFHRNFDFHYHFFDALGDGYARGLFTDYCHYAADPNTDVHRNNQSAVVKYTIDATQECCVATLGPFVPLPVEWKHFNYIAMSNSDPIHFDGIRGRLFYVRFQEKRKNQILVVIDVE
jgi:hypothetical protein